MLRVAVVTLFPELVRAVLACGVAGRAAGRGLVQLTTFDPRRHAPDRHRTVDDEPYGGGPGMVMLYRPLCAAVDEARAALGPQAHVVHLTPQGRRLTQARVQALAAQPAVVLVAGRYEGLDERLVPARVDEELSIGDYVLSGGELAAMVVIDALVRLLPGALGDAQSAQVDSFVDGLLDYPHYTRPETVDGRRVPPVLLSGDHARIARWRRKQALGRTWLRRPDLLRERVLSPLEHELLEEFVAEHEAGQTDTGSRP